MFIPLLKGFQPSQIGGAGFFSPGVTLFNWEHGSFAPKLLGFSPNPL
jgi:hypothetical protein